MKREGKGLAHGVLFACVGLAALGAALLIWLVSSAGASGESTMMLGVDVSPGANQSSSSIGEIETCVRHDVGDEFTIDIFVNNVIELTAWELRLDYDSDVVQVTDADFNYFLLSTPPGGNVLSLFESELPGRQFFGAGEISGAPDSGSGVLARVSMAAVGEGVSDVSVVDSPVYFAPRLTNKSGGAVGDNNSDGHWDGSIVGGEIRVGKSCNPNAPVITPKPSLAPGTTPNPGPGDSGSGSGSDGGGDTATGAPVVIVPGGGFDPGESGSDDSGSDAEVSSGSDSDPGSDDDGATDPGDDGSDPGSGADDEIEGDRNAVNAADDSDSSGGMALIILGLGAAALALGALAYTLSHRFRG